MFIIRQTERQFQMEGRTSRMNSNAKHFRYVSRAEAFQQKRKTYDELDYLQYYPPETRYLILQSMQNTLPAPLPPLSPTTISYYRRSKEPLFKTVSPLSGQFDPHMTYQSLWLLASLQEKAYPDYPRVVRQFQSELGQYLATQWKDIREMAVIAAGNKIIGKEEQILALVEQDTRQLWVLANHIYEGKISFTRLFSLVPLQHELALKTLFELSMLHDQEVAEALITDSSALLNTIKAAGSEHQAVKKYAFRILGNLAAVREQQIVPLIQGPLLELLVSALSCSSGEVRRDAVWVLSNLSAKKSSAKIILSHQALMAKLVDLFSFEALLNIKRELTYLFCYLAYFVNPQQALELLAHPHLLELCHDHLSIEDDQLTCASLRLLKELLDAGEGEGGGQQNCVVELLKHNNPLCCEISKKSYAQNNVISSLSLQILAFLEDEQ